MSKICLPCKTRFNLEAFIGRDRVIFLTSDGRVLKGRLEGYDQIGNVVISDCNEGDVRHGAMVVRGDNLCLIGEEGGAAGGGAGKQADHRP